MSVTEQEINQGHADRWAAAVAKYGDKYSVPWSVVTEIGEATRLAWVAFVAARTGDGEDRPRRDKTPKMRAFVQANIGRTITVGDLAEAAEASIGTAYAFINDNRTTFRKDGRGQYHVLDTAAERAAARGPASRAISAAAPSDDASAATTAVSIATAAIAHMTGEAPIVRTAGKA